ncbi:hypothetical protein BOTCAL_0054g00190 [Botryotinia calthae]|uniref:SMP-30/Gluconolactonase/LRE-like region domain-containing protein n=1 Tax=Botryotinia calthae TaxID=38488 RepID=A0A4Y8DD18_9HELO|nr:hypothetical protein BOTCAL_0054g00190 [Botryotinia calthae]
MEEHLEGVPNLLPYEIVARFPLGYFLENIAVRSDGTLLVTNMIVGQIFYVDPRDKDPESTIQLIHDFNTTSEAPLEDDEETGIYGSKNHAEAIIEHPKIADLFYAFSGVHGKADTWAVYSLDFRGFDPSRGAATTVVEKLADIPGAGWLNGATMIPQTLTLLMAESQQCKIFAFDLQTRKVSIWIEDERLGKVTIRPPWPALNGLEYFRGQIFGTVTDRGTLVKMQVDETGEYKRDSLEVVVNQLIGDDFAFDCEGSAYLATNPAHTVLKFVKVGVEPQKEERLKILGGLDKKETAGPTALAFGRGDNDSDCIYVVTCGGVVNSIGDNGPGQALIAKVCVGVRGEARDFE